MKIEDMRCWNGTEVVKHSIKALKSFDNCMLCKLIASEKWNWTKQIIFSLALSECLVIEKLFDRKKDRYERLFGARRSIQVETKSKSESKHPVIIIIVWSEERLMIRPECGVGNTQRSSHNSSVWHTWCGTEQKVCENFPHECHLNETDEL